MAHLSERELLLLNTYMYIKGVTEKRTLIENIKRLEKKLTQKNVKKYLSGGVTPEEAREVLSEIKNNERLMNLEAVKSMDGNVRAVCFVDKTDGEALVAIRGTGGIPSAWLDNMKGAYLTETAIQKEAGAFFDSIKDDYNITCITGHSKGGNLAQYITIACKNVITRCVSFDGQGFSGKFIRKYRNIISAKSAAIISISSFRDPVNGLLKPIAGEIMYIKTKFLLPGASHKSTAILDNEFFKDGKYRTSFITKKSIIARGINIFANSLGSIPIVKVPISYSLGVAFGFGMGGFSVPFLIKATALGIAGIPVVLARSSFVILKNAILIPFKAIKNIIVKPRIDSKKVSMIKEQHKALKEKISKVKANINFDYEDKKKFDNLVKVIDKTAKIADSKYYKGINEDLTKTINKLKVFAPMVDEALAKSNEVEKNKKSSTEITKDFLGKNLNNSIKKDTNISKDIKFNKGL